ncbi:MAG: hypothetical protein N2746_11815 [Deltaproteobacteria bacterium]|nr:hypothetical protein [Deltaproteobacteria bacterium]
MGRNLKLGNRLLLYILILLLIDPEFLGADEKEIDNLRKERESIESHLITLDRQYRDITDKISRLKSKKGLSILEEAELLSLMAQAQSISVQIEKKYDELEKINEILRQQGFDINRSNQDVLKLRILEANQLEGPAELREKVLILKDRENRLLREIQKLEAIEKRMRLREESQAFIREQSLFDEDSVISVVRKNVKGVAEGSSHIPISGKEDKSGYDTNISGDLSTTTTYSSTNTSPQDIKIRIEVTYEKSGIINQMNIGKDKSFLIDIDLGSMNPDELREKIELLKKIYEELSIKRSSIEKRAQEIEKLFKEKKK